MISIFTRDVFLSMLIPVFWIAIIYLIVYFAIRKISLNDNDLAPEERKKDSISALRILDERYAKGEIRTDEYSDTKKGLLGKKIKKKKKESKNDDEQPANRNKRRHYYD